MCETHNKYETKNISSKISEKGKLLTQKEVCQVLTISRTTLWHWEKQNLLVPVRIGRGLRYWEAEVLAFISGGRNAA
tara:strand:- start:24960 stop:25190 length:231 start_codon:yes stop_codon:yes gene_type:complete